MSSEYQEWLSDFTEDQRKNYELCMKYPILIPHHRWWGTVHPDFNYEYTELDGMPDGWRIAFGEEWAKEVQKAINLLPQEERDKIRITDVKEKYGQLRQYFNYHTDELDKVIRKYEYLSERTCIKCGAPATKISTGWISPWCDECAEHIYDKMVNVEEWFKQLEDDEEE